MTVITEAIDAYLQERSTELSNSSIQNHRYQLKQFREWCANEGISELESVEPIDLSRFRRARSEDINSATMYNQLSVLRLLFKFAARMGWVDDLLAESIVLPKRDGSSRADRIDADRVERIIDHLETYHFASFQHVIVSLMWTTALRIGALRAIDLQDLHIGKRYVELHHRPSKRTPLKNGEGSERELNLHGWVADIVNSWVEDKRPSHTDLNGREPVVCTANGRAARTTIRRVIYVLTACGDVTEGCECSEYPSKCPDSVSPHDIRRSSISAWLNKGVDINMLSDRVDSSPSTLERHYDVRSQSEKREARRDAFDM